MGLSTMPDGSVLPDSLARSIMRDGKRYPELGGLGVDRARRASDIGARPTTMDGILSPDTTRLTYHKTHASVSSFMGDTAQKRKRQSGYDADSAVEDVSKKRSRKLGSGALGSDVESSPERRVASSSRKRAHTSPEPLDLGGVVYRAVRSESIDLGWQQAPCTRCPQFDFCSAKGPINPAECNYFDDWLQQPVGIENMKI